MTFTDVAGFEQRVVDVGKFKRMVPEESPMAEAAFPDFKFHICNADQQNGKATERYQEKPRAHGEHSQKADGQEAE